MKSESLYGSSTEEYAQPSVRKSIYKEFLIYGLCSIKNKKPLMPCEPVIARLLLKQGKAKIQRREPFTIKLMIETTEYTRPITLGVDTGSGTIGTFLSLSR